MKPAACWQCDDVGLDTPEHEKWLKSETRKALLKDVEAAGSWFSYMAGSKLGEVKFWQDGLFASCVSRIPSCHDVAMHQIDLDIRRTFLSDVEGQPLDSLALVLRAYAVHNPKVGYCQGMNFIVAMALRVMSEEEAFWVLAYLVERLFPDYFTNMEGAVADRNCIDWMLRISVPEVVAKFDQFDGLPAVIWQAILCMFANNIVPSEGVFVLWSALFHNGRAYILRLICQLVYNCRGIVLASETGDELREAVRYYMSTLFDAVSVVNAIEEGRQASSTGQQVHCWLSYSTVKIWEKREMLAKVYKAELLAHQEGVALLHLSRSFKLPIDLLRQWSSEFHLIVQQQTCLGLQPPPQTGMSINAFHQVMTNIGIDEHTVNLTKLFKMWNVSQSQALSFDELVTGLLTFANTASLQARLQTCFATYDANDSGVLELPEVQSMMYSMHWAPILENNRSSALFSPDGTILCANFCSHLAECPSLVPTPLREGLRLSHMRLYCVLDTNVGHFLPSLISNTVKTLGSELGRVMDHRARQLNPVLVGMVLEAIALKCCRSSLQTEVAQTTFRVLQTHAFGVPPACPVQPTSFHLPNRLRANENAQVHAMLCVPPYEATLHGSFLWETNMDDPQLGLAMQHFLPQGPVGFLIRGVRYLRGDPQGSYRVIATAPEKVVLAHAHSEADINLIWTWATQTMRNTQEVAWHIKAYRWLSVLHATCLGEAPEEDVNEKVDQPTPTTDEPRVRHVSEAELSLEVKEHLTSCENAEQLWQLYQRLNDLSDDALVDCLKCAFQAHLPVVFLRWIESITDPVEMEAISEALRANKPAYDNEDSRLMDLALNRVEKLLLLQHQEADPPDSEVDLSPSCSPPPLTSP